MPFSAERPTMYANGFTMWHYKSADSVGDVLSAGYFDPAADMLRIGDFLFANLEIDRVGQNDLLVVTRNTLGVVDIATPGFLPKQPHPAQTSTSAHA